MKAGSFSLREKTWLIILAALILTALYYMLVLQPTARALSSAEEKTAQIKASMALEEAKSDRIKTMRRELEDVASGARQDVITPAYDNFQNLLDSLNSALAGTREPTFRFSEPVFERGFARRALRLSFNADSYAQAREAIKKVGGGPYRCGISAMKIVPGSSNAGDTINSPVTVTLLVNYYEIYRES